MVRQLGATWKVYSYRYAPPGLDLNAGDQNSRLQQALHDALSHCFTDLADAAGASEVKVEFTEAECKALAVVGLDAQNAQSCYIQVADETYMLPVVPLVRDASFSRSVRSLSSRVKGTPSERTASSSGSSGSSGSRGSRGSRGSSGSSGSIFMDVPKPPIAFPVAESIPQAGTQEVRPHARTRDHGVEPKEGETWSFAEL